MEKWISVILPVYNVRGSLERAMQSLEQQTIGFDHLEILFSDDCSTDGSWEKVQQFAQMYPNVRAIRREVNSGGCGAPRNDAMKIAQGEYIAFFDPDDVLPPDAYEHLYRVARESGAEFSTGYFSELDEDGNTLVKKTGSAAHLTQDRDFCFPQDLPEAFCLLPLLTCKLFRREFLAGNGIEFFPDICEDQPFAVECCLRAKKMAYINHCVYGYVQRKDSLSKRLNEAYFSGVSRGMNRCAELFEQYGQQEAGAQYLSGLLEGQMRKLSGEASDEAQACRQLEKFNSFLDRPEFCTQTVSATLHMIRKKDPDCVGKALLAFAGMIRDMDNLCRDANIWRESYEGIEASHEALKQYTRSVEKHVKDLEGWLDEANQSLQKQEQNLKEVKQLQQQQEQKLNEMSVAEQNRIRENDMLRQEVSALTSQLEAMQQRKVVRIADGISNMVRHGKR